MQTQSKCQYCGKELVANQKLYCSYSCVNKGNFKPNIKTCEWCGKEFHQPISNEKYGRGRFCSKPCKGKAQEQEYLKNKVKKVCVVCGKTFYLKKSHANDNNKCCSKECRGISQRNENATKLEKIRRHRNTDEWRTRVFERDDYTCRMCHVKNSGNLNAHHIIPLSIDTTLAYDVDNGITLCIPCHRKLHYEMLHKIQLDIFNINFGFNKWTAQSQP